MKDFIITICADTRKVKFSRDFIGIAGEHLQGNIIVDFADKADFVDGVAVFEVVQNGEPYYFDMEKISADKIYSLPIRASLLGTALTMDSQITIRQGESANAPTFKTVKFKLPCFDSISATEKFPEQAVVQLNAPEIYLNANGGYLGILDGLNGNFTDKYELYLNGEFSQELTGTYFAMQDLGITETDEIGIVAVGDMFNNSPIATARWSDLELGTIGLTYNGNRWTIGLGNVDASIADIYVASVVNGIVITVVSSGVMANDTTKRKVYLANSIRFIDYNFCRRAGNKTVVLGADVNEIATGCFVECSTGMVLDMRRVLQIPVLKGVIGASGSSTYTIVVRDDMYDDIILETNWSNSANNFVKGSIWEAQQGGSV